MSNSPILSCSKVITTHSFQSNNPQASYNPHRGLINSAVFNHTNKVIASCGQDGHIILVSSEKTDNILADLTFENNKNISINTASINCCQFSPHSKFIAAGSIHSIVKIWQMKNHKEPYLTLRSHIGSVTSISWSQSQDIIASSSINGDIFLHSVKTGSVVQQISLKGQQGINCVKFSEGETFSRLAACTNSGSIMIWDLDSTKTAKQSCIFQNQMKVSVTSLSFSRFNPMLLVTSSIDQNLIFYDILEKKSVKTIATEQPLTAVSFHSDRHTLFAGGMYGGLFIYDLRKPQKPKQKLLGHETAIKYIDSHKERGQESTNSSQFSSKQGSIRSGRQGSIRQGSFKQGSIKQKNKNSVESLPKKHINEQQFKKEEIKMTRTFSNKQQQMKEVQKLSSKKPEVSLVLNGSYQSRIVSSQQLPRKQNNSTQLQMFKKNIENSISDKFQLLHLQIIKQFQIQQQQLKAMIKKNNIIGKQKDQYIKKLEQENAKLKKNRY